MTWKGYVSCTELILSDVDLVDQFYRGASSDTITSAGVSDGVAYWKSIRGRKLPMPDMRDLAKKRVR